ncbi:hypothetical protein EVAR_83581_1 [Eumeta japonica]|uniref:Uncharacterized protein n=1 Tax=Eumeta variegata TaxID=151549 RepID=A0A4C1UPP9_EUMVA|nr:hypothetical protein EVAR_83581_1 [Eumeta japonica]
MYDERVRNAMQYTMRRRNSSCHFHFSRGYIKAFCQNRVFGSCESEHLMPHLIISRNHNGGKNRSQNSFRAGRGQRKRRGRGSCWRARRSARLAARGAQARPFCCWKRLLLI